MTGFESRLRVRPGIAGLAQWRGGYPIGPRHKLRYDGAAPALRRMAASVPCP